MKAVTNASGLRSMGMLVCLVAMLCARVPAFAQELPELNQIVVSGSLADLEMRLRGETWTKDELGAALIAAAGVNKPEHASALLSNGADVDFAVLGRTALIVAAYENSVDAALVLLMSKADPNYVSTFDWRPLHNTMREGVSNDEMILLLLTHGAEIDAPTNLLVTPLHRAAGFCLGSAVRILIDGGANSGLRDKYGQTAADRANKAGCSEVARLLE